MKEKFNELIEKVSKCFVNRDEETKIAVYSLLAGEHCCFIGDPGIAKSALIDQIVKRIGGDVKYFWLQLFGETPPTDVFGQISLKELKDNDRNKRNVEGHLPAANIAFLDEVFQARSSILVGCNSIMQEKKFMNGCEKIDVPILSIFGASNFYPEDPQLVALWDRFIARKRVDELITAEDISRMLVMKDPPENPNVIVDFSEIFEAQKEIEAIEVPDNIIDVYVNIFNKLTSLKVPVMVSSRRKKKAIKYMKVSAFLRGDSKVGVSDIWILKHIFWSKPSEISVVSEVIDQYSPVDLCAIDSIVSAVEKAFKKAELASSGADVDVSETMSMFSDVIVKAKAAKEELNTIESRARATGKVTHKKKEVDAIDYYDKAVEKIIKISEKARNKLQIS